MTISNERDSQPDVETHIAGLVNAVQCAGFKTFSSCEGHDDDRDPLSLGNVGFFATEPEALEIHKALVAKRAILKCSWVLHAGFVLSRLTGDWALGWTLENCGLIGPTDDFVKETLVASRANDIPEIIEIFNSHKCFPQT